MDLVESEITDHSEFGRHPWENSRKEVVTSLINKLIPRIKKEKNIVLDIGCGDTWLIEQLSSSFSLSNYIAVDTAFNDELIEKYRNKLDPSTFQVHAKLDDALENKEEKVDLVLLLDVIEHIEDDISFLKWVQTFSNQITPSTRFLITVPAFQSLFCKHDVFLGHYRRYTNKMLKKHIEEAGMEVEYIGYFFFSLLPLRFLDVMKEKLKLTDKDAKGVASWKEKSSDSIIKSVLIFDYKFTSFLRNLGIKLPGLSNYVICRPRAK